HEMNFYYSDDAKSRALWMWHMLEESEQKDVAYDVYQLLNGSYPLRASGFFLAFFTILGLIPATTLFIPVLRKPQEMLTRKFWKDARRGVGLIFGPKADVFGITIGLIFVYLRPDFLTNHHPSPVYLPDSNDKLLNEGGAIAPYFV
ncbi:metal-dependent hydrolase, partial [Acinetobacter baumannii]|uniref:metal-dependent hydrolase n=1 Tax=Acinetobacter baumannii TaxID=470 RepID=UPI001111C767